MLVSATLLRAAMISEQAVMEQMEEYVRALKTTMVATGSEKLEDLSKSLVYGMPYENNFQNIVSSKSKF